MLVVSGLIILIIQVKKENDDDDDGSQAGNMYVCPSALLVTANKCTEERGIQSVVQSMHVQFLVALFHSLEVDIDKVRR